MQALQDVLAERRRQIELGHDAAHDDEHVNGEIAMAACGWLSTGQQPVEWSWAANKSAHDRRKQLVIGAALALAELERYDRAALKQKAQAIADEHSDEILEAAAQADMAVHGIQSGDHITDVVQRPDFGREIVRQTAMVIANASVNR